MKKGSGMKGKHHSEETKRKISESGKKRFESKKGIHRGKGNPMWGKQHSEETKRKIGEAGRGRKLSEETRRRISEAKKGEKNPNWGKHPSEETRKKQSESHKGERSPFWRGGVSFELYGLEFNKELKSKIRHRDGNKCGLCGSKDLLHIHHVDYDKKNNDPANLVTLCLPCHSKTNTRREHWEAYFLGFADGVRFTVLNQFIRSWMKL